MNRAMGRFVVLALVSICVIPVAVVVDNMVPQPYMDEIFHIPQAQQYCKWNFTSWDPMITTPPGLYIISLPFAASLAPWLSNSCSTAILRSVNCFLAVICSVVVFEIIRHLRPEIGHKHAAIASFTLSLFPLHWFFTFLYYTDVASLTAVLSMYLACLSKKYKTSALIGVASIIVRQTNIVWMLFVACIGILDIVSNNRTSIKHAHSLNTLKDNVTGSSNMRRIRRRAPSNDNFKTPQVTSGSLFPIPNESNLYEEIQEACVTSWKMKQKLFPLFSPFVIVLLLFIAFVYHNGSLVLGAKEAHTASLHFAQLMYFALFSATMMTPVVFSLDESAKTMESLSRNWRLFVILILSCFVSVRYFSFSHPYLLADNRHYTFYLWRRIVNPMKYLLVPGYAYTLYSVVRMLRQGQSRLWVAAYLLCTAAVVVPAPLIEFRYFTVPFFFLVLHAPIKRVRSSVCMGLTFAVVDCFTMMMFLFRPFRWSHEEGSQRFIW